MTATTGAGPEAAVKDQAAVRAEAREQVRHGAAQWLTGDRTAALGRQMVLSITWYRQANRRSPTWAEAVAGVDPAPVRTDHDRPRTAGRWPRRCGGGSSGCGLMGELKRARWVTYTRTPRSLHPGDVGRGWLNHREPAARPGGVTGQDRYPEGQPRRRGAPAA